MRARKIRWGLMSTARINERLIPAIPNSEHAELLGVASRQKNSAEQYAKERSIERAYGGYEELLADPDIDVVYVSLPNSYHPEWCVKSAEAGKHILCEKPLALTLEEVDRMATAADRHGVILQEAAMYRFHPQTNKVRDLIRRGTIGDLRIVRSVFSFILDKTEDIRLESHLGGGSLWDIGSYPISFSRLVLGADPEEVTGWHVLNNRGVDTTFTGQMRFASGTFAQFSCSFRAIPRWEIEFIGAQGAIYLDHPWLNRVGEPSHVRIVHGGGAANETFGDSTSHLKMEIVTFEKTNAYQCEVDSMNASIMTGTEPVISLNDSRGNIATIVALYNSAKENRPIRIAKV
jgi:xylose dehydrogenase (NAD/NADP)